MDADRILRPLVDHRAAVDMLDAYESTEDLARAVRGTWAGVDRTLRMFLRADATAPDSIRMTAMSPEQMPVEAVLAELRRRNYISLTLAGRLHELMHAVQRAARGEVRAADADTARGVVDGLVHEVNDVAHRITAGAPEAVDAAPAPQPGADMVVVRQGSLPVRPLLIAGVAVLVLLVTLAALLLTRGESSMEQGIAAFRDGRSGVAEQHFRQALKADAESVTARLYLARILREQGRRQEAAELLRAAARTAPRDPAVRRELGYLFLDLGRPPAAVEQLRQAVELEPDEALNWVALYQAMVRAGDRGAAELLRRAPAAAQAMVRNGR